MSNEQADNPNQRVLDCTRMKEAGDRDTHATLRLQCRFYVCALVEADFEKEIMQDMSALCGLNGRGFVLGLLSDSVLGTEVEAVVHFHDPYLGESYRRWRMD